MPVSSFSLLAFVLGVLLLEQQPVLPHGFVLALLWLLLAGLLLSLGWCRRRLQRGAWQAQTVMVLAAVLAGILWASWRAELRLADALPAALEGSDVLVVGTIASLPDRIAQGQRFEFKVESVGTPGAQVPARISLGWYAGYGAVPGAAMPQVRPGERWQLRVRLRKPHGNANPYGFDYEGWLLEQGVRATGYVRPEHATNQRLAAFVWDAGHVIERVREALRDRIEAALPGAPYAGVIVALVMGDQRGIDQREWQVFSRTGISHLVSISGLHVTMLAGAGASLVFVLWRAWVRRRGVMPAGVTAQRAAALTGALVALVYCLLAGMGVPAQRTLIMLSVVAGALCLGRPVAASRVLALALFVVVWIDPWAVLAAGFWLSFGAVALIFYVTAGRISVHAESGVVQRSLAGLLVACRVQWAMTVGLVPLSLLLFHQLSLVSPLANALAIPLVSLVVTPLALLGALVPGLAGDLVLRLAHGVMALLAGVLDVLSAWPWATWPAPVAPVWSVALGLLGVAWGLAPRGWPLRGLGALAMLPALLWPVDRPAEGRLRLSVFDVGQGTAVLIETRQHRYLYDSGPAYSPETDAGSRVLLPYLRARGIGALDGLIISHRDNDHSGGALSILQSMPVAWLASSLRADEPIVRQARRALRCDAGQVWQSGGFEFAFLHPTGASHQDLHLKPNARSCVLRIRRPGVPGVLLTGDIEKAQEAELLARLGSQALQSDVLLVPHHGSMTSSSEVFLDAVQPGLAVVQAGYLNRFGHPRAAILDRYDERKVAVLRTDHDGAITLQLSATGMEVQAWRRQQVRYWQER